MLQAWQLQAEVPNYWRYINELKQYTKKYNELIQSERQANNSVTCAINLKYEQFRSHSATLNTSCTTNVVTTFPCYVMYLYVVNSFAARSEGSVSLYWRIYLKQF